MGYQMADQTQIKLLAKEAELYRTQGLLEESREKYLKALQLIEDNPRFQNNTKARKTIKDKILRIERDLAEIEQETGAPELSGELQDLIKSLFSFSEDKGAAEMEGAEALARFGQYERAIAEFDKLLKKGTLPLAAAKNILRCHLALSSTDAAINQFQQWLSGELLSRQQLRNIRSFLEYILRKKGVQKKLPEVPWGSSQKSEDTESSANFLDICSIRFRVESGSSQGGVKELDVTFQSGPVISLIVSAKDEDMLDTFVPGIRLKGVHFFSSIAVFRADATISEYTRIKTGPRRGDYILSITIDRTDRLDIL
jgi:hypothetical protein